MRELIWYRCLSRAKRTQALCEGIARCGRVKVRQQRCGFGLNAVFIVLPVFHLSHPCLTKPLPGAAWDSDLLSALLFELFRANVAQSAVQSHSVIENFDPLKNALTSFLPRRVSGLIHQFFLQARKETF